MVMYVRTGAGTLNNLGYKPTKGNLGVSTGRWKFDAGGFEPATLGLDQPMICRLSYEANPVQGSTRSPYFVVAQESNITPFHASLQYASIKGLIYVIYVQK